MNQYYEKLSTIPMCALSGAIFGFTQQVKLESDIFTETTTVLKNGSSSAFWYGLTGAVFGSVLPDNLKGAVSSLFLATSLMQKLQEASKLIPIPQSDI